MPLDEEQRREVSVLIGQRRWGLFNQMGVGKSFPAIVAAVEKLPCLVVCPAYLIPQWRGYVAEWAPGRVILGQKELKEGSEGDFFVVSYHFLNNEEGFDRIKRRKWGCIVFDEAHRLRNHKSRWTKRVFELDNKGAKNHGVPMWFLTGTPIVRDGGDIWPFLHLCDRGKFRGYWKFVKEWCEVVETPWGAQVKGIRDPKRFQREILSKFSSRRALKGVQKSILIDIPVETPFPLQKMIKKAKKEYVIAYPDGRGEEAVRSGGALWSKIRRWVTHTPFPEQPKLAALSSLVENELPNVRVIIWCYYKDSAQAIFDYLSKGENDRPIFVHTGDCSRKEKDFAIEGYRKEGNSVLIATISSMSLGVNLQEGHHQVFVEESTIPSDNKQAVGRQYRRGQEEAVVVHRIIARGKESVDEEVRKLASGRDKNVTEIIQGYLRRDL